MILETKLEVWIEQWRELTPAMDLRILAQVHTGPISYDIAGSRDEWGPSDIQLDGYPLAFASPDGTKILSVAAGGMLPPDISFEERRKFNIEFEPDSEVALIEIQSNMYKRTLSCGTPCGFDRALWLDNERFVVTGHSEYYPPNGEKRCIVGTPCTVVPTLHLFDLTRGIVTVYEGSEIDRQVFDDFLHTKYKAFLEWMSKNPRTEE